MGIRERLSEDVAKMRLILAINLYDRAQVSLHEAAEMIDANSAEFIGLMGDYKDGIIFE